LAIIYFSNKAVSICLFFFQNYNRPGMMACNCNPSTQEIEIGGWKLEVRTGQKKKNDSKTLSQKKQARHGDAYL
jgi:hypothetical protein